MKLFCLVIGIVFNLLIFLLPIDSRGQVDGQKTLQANVGVNDTSLIIDMNVLNAEQKNRLLVFQAKKSMAEGTVDTIINTEKTLRKAISDYTKLHSKLKAFAVYQTIVEKLNEIAPTDKVKIGEELYMPIIFALPGKKSNPNYIQSIDYSNAKIKVSSLDNDMLDSSIQHTPDVAGFVKLMLTNEQFLEVKNNVIGSKEFDRLNNNGIKVLDHKLSQIYFPVNETQVETTNIKPSQVSDSLLIKLKKLTANDFGVYYVLDFFTEGECSHGNKVVSVIKQKFRELGIDSSFLKLKTISVDYKNDPQGALNFLRAFYSTYSSGYDQTFGLALVKELEERQLTIDSTCGKCIPSEVLLAYLSDCYFQEPDVISTSFYISTQKTVTPNFRQNGTTFVTACLNEPNKRIESLDELDADTETSQPLAALYHQPQLGGITVSSQIRADTFDGMYSKEGNGVSTIGQGGGWDFEKYCNKPYTGASFAVPDIGATMLIAKAFWKSNGFKPPAQEAKIRLLLSADISSSLVGKFGSGGRPNLEKLIVIGNGYFQDINNNIDSCTIKPGSKIFFNNFKRGTGINDVSGLAISGGNLYYFSELKMSWCKSEFESIDVTVVRNGNEEHFTSIDALKLKYKYLINLKN
ncbi:hypothetical protein PV783_24560 [Chitinophaga sp. CC14]|uniref:hypothetical protein n=1 Tax=Chitinophaga sp. CC14 TaxID=3029199 RepID=UPI003B76C9E9